MARWWRASGADGQADRWPMCFVTAATQCRHVAQLHDGRLSMSLCVLIHRLSNVDKKRCLGRSFADYRRAYASSHINASRWSMYELVQSLRLLYSAPSADNHRSCRVSPWRPKAKIKKTTSNEIALYPSSLTIEKK